MSCKPTLLEKNILQLRKPDLTETLFFLAKWFTLKRFLMNNVNNENTIFWFSYQTGLKTADITDRRTTSYCEGIPYDTSYYLCCSGVVTPKTGSKPRCCGTQSYDYASELCCQGNIYPKEGVRPGCCGNLAFDAEFFLCCQPGSISPKRGSRPRCCGSQGYDPEIERCCLGYVVVTGLTCPWNWYAAHILMVYLSKRSHVFEFIT